ncbi:cellular nucleic acid-binding protein-like [Belonocnema kinseyi]|uniref:cellular nucleic acid-binding protein-like n=1 Tax=Belonocnema kinseyi TaxID=2817044 RepID=UPI00143DEBEF|nr:cellular nucleic acid-binding protein-like [Belonocnema kinseyi]
MKVSFTKRPFRGNLKAFAELSDELAARLVRAGHLKVGWVSCHVSKRIEAMKCYRCPGFGHMAAKCEGPDRTKSCWRCGKEGSKAVACESTPQCYLCVANGDAPLTDHRLGTRSCLAFREAASLKKPLGLSI